MLSTDMMRYVELHRALGFRFRTQHQLLSSFSALADAHGDEFVRIEHALDWASRPHHLNGANAFSRSCGLR
jgi:hypothetical protein